MIPSEVAPVAPGAEVEEVAEVNETPRSRGKARVFFHNRSAVIGLIGLTLIVLAVVFAGVIAPHNPNELNFTNTYASPTWSHPLGTDDLGRDIFSRLLYGGRAPLMIAGCVVLIGALIALPIGLSSGYVG